MKAGQMPVQDSKGRLVADQQLQEGLQSLVREVEDPRAGIHPAGSISWEINREWVLFLGGGCALLLQLAHPFVAQAVERHSQARKDAWGRFLRTFRRVWAMSFGTLDEALEAAVRVHRIHAAVRGRMDEAAGVFAAGSPYAANQPEALLWVYATLVETAVRVFELTVRPLHPEEKEEFYQQSKFFARLFGLRGADLPSGWNSFLEYWEEQLAGPVIVVSPAARRMSDFLFTPPVRVLWPAVGWYRAMTAGLLPSDLRRGFGLPFLARDRRIYGATLRAARGLLPWCPGRLRYLPAYFGALRRVSRTNSKR